jgi:hypothetical protein
LGPSACLSCRGGGASLRQSSSHKQAAIACPAWFNRMKAGQIMTEIRRAYGSLLNFEAIAIQMVAAKQWCNAQTTLR